MTQLDDPPDIFDPPTIPKSTILDLLPANPSRLLDWRWQRAGQLLEPRARRRRWDDAWVVRARRFRKALARYVGDLRHPRLAGTDPDVLGACLLFRGEPPRRWQLEARLLAGQADTEIAARMCLPAGTIEAYESLFYGVRHALKSSDWIMARAIGARAYDDRYAADMDILLKRVGYHCGPLFLDRLIEALDPSSTPADPSLAQQFRLMAKVLTTPLTAKNGLLMIRLHAEFERLLRAEADQSAGPVMKPLIVELDEVRIGPATLKLKDDTCMPSEPDSIDSLSDPSHRCPAVG